MTSALNLTPVNTVLLALTYLVIKHWIADFVLQTDSQRHQKAIYGAAGGLKHALIHVGLTAPVFLILTAVPPITILMLLAGEFAVHYHIDWAKEKLVRDRHLTVTDREFWWTIGFDQMLHGLTYIAIVWIAVHDAL